MATYLDRPIPGVCGAHKKFSEHCAECRYVVSLESKAQAADKLVKAIEQVIPRVGDTVIYLKLDDAMAEYYRSVKPPSSESSNA